MVLVQGTAAIDDADLEANRERYARESVAKLPATKGQQPPKALQGWFGWYYTRLYIRVRPERVYVWAEGDWSREPELYDAHLEEVRSGHDEEPESAPPPVTPGAADIWDPRMESFGDLYDTAVLSVVAPDGFPFSVRVPVAVDRAARRVRIGPTPLGLPLESGLACLAAHDHDEQFTWQRNFHIRGDLVEEDDGGWSVVPRKLVGGFELPPGSIVERMRQNIGKIRRFRKIAKRELAKRGH
jgi:hypothetical protein